MRNWCSRHPVWFMALYALFYLTFFSLLEHTVLTPDLWVHCRLDDVIPFCKYAIVPYLLWFPWIPFTLFYLLYKAPREDFWRLCVPLFTGMTMALLFYVIVPNGLALHAFCAGQRHFRAAGADDLPQRHADERLSVHPCLQLGHADAGLLPQCGF